MAGRFPPQFKFFYFNGVYVVQMNPQMALELAKANKEAGDAVNLTFQAQMGLGTAKALQEMCDGADSHIVNRLGESMSELLEELAEGRRQWQERQDDN